MSSEQKSLKQTFIDIVGELKNKQVIPPDGIAPMRLASAISNYVPYMSVIEDIAGYQEYSETASYSVGDLVFHDKKLMKCISAVSEEQWDDDKWQQTQLSSIYQQSGNYQPAGNYVSSENEYTTSSDVSTIVEGYSYQPSGDYLSVSIELSDINQNEISNYTTSSQMSVMLNEKYNSVAVTDAFDTQTSYDVGDYVTYQGNLYKCVESCDAGTFNVDNFISTQLLDEDAQLVVDDETYELKVKDSMDEVVWDSTTDKMFSINYESSNEAKYGYIQYLSVGNADFSDGKKLSIIIPEIIQNKSAEFILDISVSTELTEQKTIGLDIDNYNYYCDNDKNIADMMNVSPGDIFRLRLIGCALVTDDKSSFYVTRTNIKMSTPST